MTILLTIFTCLTHTTYNTSGKPKITTHSKLRFYDIMVWFRSIFTIWTPESYLRKLILISRPKDTYKTPTTIKIAAI